MDLVPEIAAAALLGPGRIGIERALHQLARRPLLDLGRAARFDRLHLARRCRFGWWLLGRRLGRFTAASTRLASISVPCRTIRPKLSIWRLTSSNTRSARPRSARLAEAMDRHIVRRLGVQCEAAEPAETQPILDRRLQGGVRQPMPLLQQQCLEHHHRRVARCAVARSMHRRQQPRDRRPVDQFIEPLQRRVPPALATRLSAKLS